MLRLATLRPDRMGLRSTSLYLLLKSVSEPWTLLNSIFLSEAPSSLWFLRNHLLETVRL